MNMPTCVCCEATIFAGSVDVGEGPVCLSCWMLPDRKKATRCTCHGIGLLAHRLCMGDGCDECYGTGIVVCAECRVWLDACHGCHGIGVRPCKRCDGTGYTQCRECESDIPCRKCDGNGYRPCKYCQRSEPTSNPKMVMEPECADVGVRMTTGALELPA